MERVWLVTISEAGIETAAMVISGHAWMTTFGRVTSVPCSK